MRPEQVHVLEGKAAKRFIKQMNSPVSKRDKAAFKRARKVYKGIKQAK